MNARLREVLRIAREAGTRVMAIYDGDFTVIAKADASPVTAADEAAEAFIVPALQALAPGSVVVAEEACARSGAPPVGDAFWLVDPLDGTREFVARNGEFTVNIAWVEHGVPVSGVVHVPALGVSYAACVGQGAWRVDAQGEHAIACRQMPLAPLLACSRSHGDESALQQWLRGRAVGGRIEAGSALKFGLLAAGRADIYPRFGRTMEWDTAAGHALLLAAGGGVVTLDGAPLRYGKPGFENPHFIAHGPGFAAF